MNRANQLDFSDMNEQELAEIHAYAEFVRRRRAEEISDDETRNMLDAVLQDPIATSQFEEMVQAGFASGRFRDANVVAAEIRSRFGLNETTR